MQTSLRRFYPEMVNHGNSKCKNLTIMRRAHTLWTMTFRCESYLNRNPAINPQMIRFRTPTTPWAAPEDSNRAEDSYQDVASAIPHSQIKPAVPPSSNFSHQRAK